MSSNAVGRPMEILLVEDSLTAARVTIGALKRGKVQHRLTWLTDGAEAIEFLENRGKYVRAPRPDLILLDLELPGRDGRAVLADIKADESLRSIPVVILTSSTSQEDAEAMKRLEVEGYMTKPVDLEKFLALVRQLERFWHADMILPTAP